MDEVTIKKTELLDIMRKNRDAHTQIYKDAVEGFKVDAKSKLEKALKTLDKGSLPSSISFVAPKDHTDEYNDVIRMLELEVDDEITLRRHEFENYVLDKWVSAQEKSMLRSYALSSSNSAAYSLGA